MKFRYFIIAGLSVMMIFCNAKSISNDKDARIHNLVDHQQSKLLIDRYNKVRYVNGLNRITHDTILDNVCKTIIANSKYRNSDNTFIEDSVRHLLYRNGVIDYQYEIKIASDKDTTDVFNSVLLADKSNNLRMGYNKYGNKNILFKTKSYLRFEHWSISVHSDVIDMLHNKNTEATLKTDSVICYFKVPEPGKYYYQFYNRIPLSTDKLKDVEKFEIQTEMVNNTKTQDMYDLIIKSTDPNAFLIISNKDNERVVVIK